MLGLLLDSAREAAESFKMVALALADNFFLRFSAIENL
jgi:hypothetical protein